jgi:hypothetical protein
VIGGIGVCQNVNTKSCRIQRSVLRRKLRHNFGGADYAITENAIKL